MNTLYLVRHGENLANLTLEFSHHAVDYSLTPKGLQQAEQTAAWFIGKPVEAIYTSPLKRAAETAGRIGAALGLRTQPLEAFREINVGRLEGQKPTRELWALHDSIIAAWMDGHPETRFPDGENYIELLARIRAGFETILAGKTGSTLVVVGHGGVLSFALPGLCPAIDPRLMDRGMGNCAITEVRAGLQDGRLEMRLVSYASTAHLSGAAADLALGSYPKD